MNSYPAAHPFTSVSEMLTDSLRRSILSGELEEGQSLRQQTIARRYGVSEVMVREAFRRLEAEGLVEGEPRRGVRVSRHSVEEIRELYELRVLLEKLITRHAVRNCTEQDIAEAEAILKEMDHESDPVRWLSLNRDFHNCLFQPSHRRRLLKFAGHLRLMLERYLRLSLGVLKRFEIAQREHRAVLAAYRARDARLAAKHVGAHLQGTVDFIVSFLRAKDRAAEAAERETAQVRGQDGRQPGGGRVGRLSGSPAVPRERRQARLAPGSAGRSRGGQREE